MPADKAPMSGGSREILLLAVPAFLALVAEPLFLLADTAVVAHLGTAALAGLSVASAALLTAANLFVFLAYGTTGAVARQVGAGSVSGALSTGIDGIWLAAGLGVATAAVVGGCATALTRLFGAGPAVSVEAATYLRVSALGIPGMLIVLAVTGVLRGLQDTRTPLVVSVIGFSTNIALNVLFVLVLRLGIAGSALGTVLTQTGMALALGVVVLRRTRGHLVRLRPHPTSVLRVALAGAPLVVRTLALRAVLLITTWVAAGLGDTALAAHQVAMSMWSLLSFALDALAIAAQALTGRALGAGDTTAVRAATTRMLRWGVGSSVVLGLAVLLSRDLIPLAFTHDPAVRAPLVAALIVIGLSAPISGVVFVLDGVLIGAGDGRWLAGAQVAVLVVYLPVALLVRHAYAAHPLGAPTNATLPVTALWLGVTWFMLVRAALLAWRARSDAWLVTGEHR